jgi:hypothetical protein
MANRGRLNKGYLSEVERGKRPVSSRVAQLYDQALGRVPETETPEEIAAMPDPDTDEAPSDYSDLPKVVVARTMHTLPRRDQQHIASVVDAPVKRVCARLGMPYSVPDRLAETGDIDIEVAHPIIKQAGAFLAYAGVNDARTGLEIAFAHMAQVPIILLYEVGNAREADQWRQSNIPIYRELPIRDADEFEEQLAEALFWLYSSQSLVEAARRSRWPTSKYQERRQRLEQLRRQPKKPIRWRRPITVDDWGQSDPLLTLEGELALA